MTHIMNIVLLGALSLFLTCSASPAAVGEFDHMQDLTGVSTPEKEFTSRPNKYTKEVTTPMNNTNKHCTKRNYPP